MKPARILITGAGGSAAHNFVDALKLSSTDYYLVGTDTRPYHLELAQTDQKYLVPPVSDPGYLPTMNKIIDREKIDLVHTQPDVEVAFLAQYRDKLNAKVFLPPTSEIDLCHDKLRFNEVLKQAGVGVPEAYHLVDDNAVERAVVALRENHSKVWVRAIRGAGSKASLPISSAAQAKAWIAYWVSEKGLRPEDFMASQFLPGREFAWQSLWHEGKLVSSQGRERVEYVFGNLTPSGQTSSPSVARTVSRQDVNAVSEAAVRAVSRRPHGVYGVDMKEDEAGRPLVTEINIGRFFTTSNFFAHAGLNLPEMYVRLGLGQAVGRDVQQYNPLPDDLYWVRMMDMGYKLVKGDAWQARDL